jgi:hypothetical protein
MVGLWCGAGLPVEAIVPDSCPLVDDEAAAPVRAWIAGLDD